MEKYIYNESNGLWYERRGNTIFPACPCQRKKKRPSACENSDTCGISGGTARVSIPACKLSGELYSYLSDINQQAQIQLDIIIQQMAQAQGITEELKDDDTMAWVGRMNNIQKVLSQRSYSLELKAVETYISAAIVVPLLLLKK